MINNNLKNSTINSEGLIDDKLNSGELLDFVIDLINKEEKDKIISFFKDLHPADIAEIIQKFDDNKRENLLEILKDNFNLETLTYLDDIVRDEIIGFLGIESLAPNVTTIGQDRTIFIGTAAFVPAMLHRRHLLHRPQLVNQGSFLAIASD